MKIPKIFQFFPPIFIFIMTLFLIYLYLNHCLFPLYFNERYIITILLWGILSFCLIMWFWGFFGLIFGDPGEINNELKYIKNFNCNFKCNKCNSLKPFRTHHCSQCNKCFAKMDHHCVVLGKCIAIRNQKTFIVYLFYCIILNLIWFISSILSIFLIKYEIFPRIMIIDLFGSSSLLFLISILFFDQIYNLYNGNTTLEIEFKSNIKNNENKFKNLYEVLGPFSIDWFIPTPTSIKYSNCFSWEYLRIK